MGSPRLGGTRLVTYCADGDFWYGRFNVLETQNETLTAYFFRGLPHAIDEEDWSGIDNPTNLGVWRSTVWYVHLPIVPGGAFNRFHTVSAWYRIAGVGTYRELDFESVGTQQPICKAFFRPVAPLAVDILIRLDCENYTGVPLIQEFMISSRDGELNERSASPFGKISLP